MAFSVLLTKYLLTFSGFISATIIPFMYSSVDVSSLFRGGQLNDLNRVKIDKANNNLQESEQALASNRDHSESVLSRSRRDISLRPQARDINSSQLSLVNIDTSGSQSYLKIDHDLDNVYRSMVSYDKFKEIYGSRNLREEGDIALKGGNNMSILDAWENFFKNEKFEGSTNRESFFSKNKSLNLPFWNYDFPYIAVELPKGFQLPRNLIGDSVSSDWIKVIFSSEGQETKTVGPEAKGIKEAVQKFNQVFASTGEEQSKHIREKTLNRIMQPSENSDLYIVSSPEKLLRLWLSDWDNLKLDRAWGDKYALFENKHYIGTLDHPEVSILRRWYNGKTYRMWIYHKVLNSSQISANKTFSVGYEGAENKEKQFKLELKWSSNFLLNLMTWYAYSFKTVTDSYNSWSSDSQVGNWNLKKIYSISEREGQESSFTSWLNDWYKGRGRDDYSYWWNKFTLSKLKRLQPLNNRWERINWVGEMMDKLLESWGKLENTRITD